MCSVSTSPVMKITGTLLKPASRFSRRQVSKPSMPGMTASSRMMSGVMRSTIRIALAPSSATITVMPALSSASVKSRSVSGESSTTSAMSRVLGSRVLGSMIMGVQDLQRCHVLIEIDALDQGTHLRHEVGMFGVFVANFIELERDRLDMADLSEPDQFLDLLDRRARPAVRPPARLRRLVAVIAPFDLEQLPDGFQKARNVDRFHQIAVVEGLRQRRAMRFQRARRDHQDAGLAMAVLAQRFRNRPAV